VNGGPPTQSEIDYGCALEVDTRRDDKRFATRIVLLIWLLAIALGAFTIWGFVR